MPLTWSIAKVENWEALVDRSEDRECWPDNPNEPIPTYDEVVTHALVFASMATGINEITEKNVDEVIFRIRVLEEVNGKFIHKSGEWMPIPASDIRRRIGLHTNASKKTKAQFDKDIAWHLSEKVKRQIRMETREQEKEEKEDAVA